MASWVIPDLPHAFWGEVSLGGQPAPVGTVIVGRTRNARYFTPNNPFTLTEAGKLGGGGGFDPKMVVQGDFSPDGAGNIPVGEPIFFFVEGDTWPLWVYSYEQGGYVYAIPYEIGGVSQVYLVK